VFGVADQGGGLDPPAHAQLVAGDELITHDAEHGRGDPGSDVAGALVGEQFVDAFDPGEHRTGPDHQGDTESGQVFGALQTVGVALGGGTSTDPEAQEHQQAGGDV
jgi:hypothetical protein